MTTTSHRIVSDAPPVVVVFPGGVVGRIDAEYYRPAFVMNDAELREGQFTVARLGELISRGNYGSLPDSVDYISEGIPLIRGTDLRFMSVTLESAVRVPEGYLDKYKKARVQVGDLLMLAKGASLDRPDSVAMYSARGHKAIANASIFIMQPDTRKVNPFFLLGSLASERFLLQKRRASTNTGALYNDIASISGFLVPLPDRRVQNYIGGKVALAERCRKQALVARKQVELLFEELLLESRFDTQQVLSRWVLDSELTTRWLNAGFYRQVYSELHAHLRSASVQTIPLGRIAQCNRTKIRPQGNVRYIEISDIDPEDGVISGGRDCSPDDTPTNAQRVIATDDILMSTRRPDRGAVACVRADQAGSFCSVFLARIQCIRSEVLPRFLHEYLRRPTAKLLIAQRCTETTYPVISEDDIETVPVPLAPRRVQESISAVSLRAGELRRRGIALINEATADVEALIEGTLDMDAILSGKLNAPSADGIPELAKRGA